MKKSLASLLVLFAISISQSGAADFKTNTASSVVDSIGREYQLLRVEADGFEKLSEKDKEFAYNIFRAGLPGRETFFALNHRHAPKIKNILETFLTPLVMGAASERAQAAAAFNPKIVEKIKAYAAYLMINGCQYNVLTKTKYTLELGNSPDESRKIFEAAMGKSLALQPFSDRKGAQSAYMKDIGDVAQSMFDPKYEPMWMSTDASTDYILASNSAFYDKGVTLDDVTTLKDGKRVPNAANRVVNSRIAKTSSGIVEQVFSIREGHEREDGFLRDYGLFSRELARSARWLERAKPLTRSAQQQNTIQKYIDFLQTGEEASFWDANKSWIKDKDFTVDFTFGWVEQYADPLNVKGAWQTSIAYIDPDLNALMKGLADNNDYFEKKMPWPDRYKLADVAAPKVDVHMIVHESGFMQSMTIAGINLPNNNEIREDPEYGAKNMILQNNSDAFQRGQSAGFNEEFLTPELQKLKAKWGKAGAQLLVSLHEVIGHGSGKMDEGVDYQSLGSYYGSLEENRADLCAIYHSSDALFEKLGFIDVEAGADIAAELKELQYYILYNKINAGFVALRTTNSDTINQAHQQGHTMTLNWLRLGPKPLIAMLESSPSLSQSTQSNLKWLKETLAAHNVGENDNFWTAIEEVGGKHFVVIHNRERAIEGAGILLALLQVVKGSGDQALLGALYDTYIKSDAVLTEFFGAKGSDDKRHGGYRDELIQRAENLTLTNFNTFVTPTLIRARNSRGENTIALSYPRNLDDFLAQQVYFSWLARQD